MIIICITANIQSFFLNMRMKIREQRGRTSKSLVLIGLKAHTSLIQQKSPNHAHSNHLHVVNSSFQSAVTVSVVQSPAELEANRKLLIKTFTVRTLYQVDTDGEHETQNWNLTDHGKSQHRDIAGNCRGWRLPHSRGHSFLGTPRKDMRERP